MTSRVKMSGATMGGRVTGLNLQSNLQGGKGRFTVSRRRRTLVGRTFSRGSRARVRGRARAGSRARGRRISSLIYILRTAVSALRKRLRMGSQRVRRRTRAVAQLASTLTTTRRATMTTRTLRTNAVRRRLITKRKRRLRRRQRAMPHED